MGKIKKKQKPKRRSVGYFLRNFTKKHRVSIRDQYSDTEVSYMYISTMRIVLAFLGTLIVMAAVVISLIIYTPILDNLPGNPGRKSREMLMQNIMRLDSLQHELTVMLQYSENVALVMEGKTPAVRTINRAAEDERDERELTPRTEADSLLRAQLEAAEGRYALSAQAQEAAGAQGGGPRSISFLIPVAGEVAAPFNPAARMYGIAIAMAESQQIVAAAAGTVISSMWSPEDDYVIQIQHGDNYVTSYKRATQLLKSAGDRVESGEVIGYVDVARMAGSENLKGNFVFEIWNDGRPIDPERYILF